MIQPGFVYVYGFNDVFSSYFMIYVIENAILGSFIIESIDERGIQYSRIIKVPYNGFIKEKPCLRWQDKERKMTYPGGIHFFESPIDIIIYFVLYLQKNIPDDMSRINCFRVEAGLQHKVIYFGFYRFYMSTINNAERLITWLIQVRFVSFRVLLLIFSCILFSILMIPVHLELTLVLHQVFIWRENSLSNSLSSLQNPLSQRNQSVNSCWRDTWYNPGLLIWNLMMVQTLSCTLFYTWGTHATCLHLQLVSGLNQLPTDSPPLTSGSLRFTGSMVPPLTYSLCKKGSLRGKRGYNGEKRDTHRWDLYTW